MVTIDEKAIDTPQPKGEIIADRAWGLPAWRLSVGRCFRREGLY
jgi:hypothetical protein